MRSTPTVGVEVVLDAQQWETELAAECARGLLGTPKELSPVWFYDRAGSDLFEEITRLEEYYPTRAERSLLDAHAPDIIQRAAPDTLVELGSGSPDKARCLLDVIAASTPAPRYVPLDVSESALRAAADQLADAYPGLEIHAIVGDFLRHLSAIPDGGTRLISFLGGTIGNLAPVHRRHFLRDLRSITHPGDSVLIGIDLIKDADVLVRAYDDAAGVTAAFNRNALTHLNWRLGADFRPDAFEHVAVWNPDDRRIEMHLLSALDQQVTLAALGMTVKFHRGETLLTEISAKFSPEQFAGELAAAGFVTLDRWTAEPGYQLVLAGPTEAPC